MSYFSYVFYVLAVRNRKFTDSLLYSYGLVSLISIVLAKNSRLNSVIILFVLLGQKSFDIMTSHILVIYVSSCCYIISCKLKRIKKRKKIILRGTVS